MSTNRSVVCRDDASRRTAIRDGALNGLDFVDVDDADRTKLLVHFIAALGKLRDELTHANFAITGGRRVHDIAVTDVRFGPQGTADADVCTGVCRSGRRYLHLHAPRRHSGAGATDQPVASRFRSAPCQHLLQFLPW